MAQEIVFYHSAMAGAPSGTLTAVGTLIAVLDACLTDGFNSISVSTLTQTGGTATATTASNHNFSVGDWIEVAGADQSGYNGRVKVLSKPASNQFTYTVAGGTATPATGTITAKHPGAGWLKTSLGTNIKSYQGGSGSLGFYMQIEDNNPYADGNLSIRARMAKGLTALDTVDSSGQLGPQVKQLKLTGGWMLIADKKTCYMFFGTLSGGMYSFAFGEMTSFYSGDQYPMFMTNGESGSSLNVYSEANGSFGFSACSGRYFPTLRYNNTVDITASAAGSCFTMRGISQQGGHITSQQLTMSGTWRTCVTQNVFTPISQDFFGPNLADNSLPVVPIFNYEFGSNVYTLRGKHRGIYWPLAGLPSGFANNFQKLDAAMIDGVSQPMLLVNTQNFGTTYTGTNKQVAFQLEGSWS